MCFLSSGCFVFVFRVRMEVIEKGRKAKPGRQGELCWDVSPGRRASRGMDLNPQVRFKSVSGTFPAFLEHFIFRSLHSCTPQSLQQPVAVSTGNIWEFWCSSSLSLKPHLTGWHGEIVFWIFHCCQRRELSTKIRNLWISSLSSPVLYIPHKTQQWQQQRGKHAAPRPSATLHPHDKMKAEMQSVDLKLWFLFLFFMQTYCFFL